MRTRIPLLLMAMLSIGVSLFGVEVALRVLHRYTPPNDPPIPSRPDLYQPDDRVGYRLWRSTVTCYRYPPNSPRVLSLVSNSDGFRGRRELDDPDPRTRILVVGDSFVFGSGVSEEERLTEVLEEIEPSWRVDNLGMTGWGIDLMLRAIEAVGVKASPDAVVLAVYTDDFRRLLPYYSGVGYAIPKFQLDETRLISVPYPVQPRWERMRVFQVVYQNYWRLRRNRYDLNGALLDRFLADAGQQSFHPVVVFLPGRDDTEEDRERRGWLREWCERRGTPFLDLTETIHGAGVDNVFIEGNWHWNPLGHRIAAEALRRFLAAEVIPGRAYSALRTE